MAPEYRRPNPDGVDHQANDLDHTPNDAERDAASVWYQAQRQARYFQWMRRKWVDSARHAATEHHRNMQRLRSQRQQAERRMAS